MQAEISIDNKKAKLFHRSNSQSTSYLESVKKRKCAVAVETEHKNTLIRSSTSERIKHTAKQLMEPPVAHRKG